MWISLIAIAVLSVPFILIWWRDMDRWADAEHKRFKPRQQASQDVIVVKQQHGPQDGSSTQ
jgi:membrane protein implicated in regulation of membrane protease activity